jgi:uncharacterized protein YkwD
VHALIASRFSLIPSVLLVSLLMAGCGTTQPGTDPSLTAREREPVACVMPDAAERMADQVLQLVNLERVAAGLAPVVENPILAQVAGDYACRMIENNFFAHEDPYNGYRAGDRALAAKYRFYLIGENLAAGHETPAQAMREWMNSATHREVVLDPRWSEVGIAVRTGGEYGIYWVQEFGNPARTTRQ